MPVAVGFEHIAARERTRRHESLGEISARG